MNQDLGGEKKLLDGLETADFDELGSIKSRDSFAF